MPQSGSEFKDTKHTVDVNAVNTDGRRRVSDLSHFAFVKTLTIPQPVLDRHSIDPKRNYAKSLEKGYRLDESLDNLRKNLTLKLQDTFKNISSSVLIRPNQDSIKITALTPNKIVYTFERFEIFEKSTNILIGHTEPDEALSFVYDFSNGVRLDSIEGKSQSLLFDAIYFPGFTFSRRELDERYKDIWTLVEPKPLLEESIKDDKQDSKQDKIDIKKVGYPLSGMKSASEPLTDIEITAFTNARDTDKFSFHGMRFSDINRLNYAVFMKKQLGPDYKMAMRHYNEELSGLIALTFGRACAANGIFAAAKSKQNFRTNRYGQIYLDVTVDNINFSTGPVNKSIYLGTIQGKSHLTYKLTREGYQLVSMTTDNPMVKDLMEAQEKQNVDLEWLLQDKYATHFLKSADLQTTINNTVLTKNVITKILFEEIAIHNAKIKLLRSEQEIQAKSDNLGKCLELHEDIHHAATLVKNLSTVHTKLTKYGQDGNKSAAYFDTLKNDYRTAVNAAAQSTYATRHRDWWKPRLLRLLSCMSIFHALIAGIQNKLNGRDFFSPLYETNSAKNIQRPKKVLLKLFDHIAAVNKPLQLKKADDVKDEKKPAKP